MYHCGPTVYDTPHIGNYRTFVLNDLVRRVFEYNSYSVDQVMNITDVDDKTIRRSNEAGIPLSELTKKYESLFIQGLLSLNVLVPQKLVRATEHVSAMISLIQTLLDKDIAYRADDGIYVSIAKVKDYGQLAGLDLSKSTHERIANDEYDKEDPRDFAVWKFSAPATDIAAVGSDISWEAPFGKGRPGWHIECSAMAMEMLGTTIDIHTGGRDLIFPHHTNEIAQSESATGKQFVRYWLHGEFVVMADEKMAKSKGNILKLDDLETEMISPLAYRYWLLTSHYRSPIHFSYEAVRAAQTGLIRLMNTVVNYPEGGEVLDDYKTKFLGFINNDLDLPQAMALAWELINNKKVSAADKKATLLDFDRVFGLKLDTIPKVNEEIVVPPEVQALIDTREEARHNKDWVKADALRKEINSRGFEITDKENGVIIRSL